MVDAENWGYLAVLQSYGWIMYEYKGEEGLTLRTAAPPRRFQ